MTSEEKKVEILNYIFKSKDGASWNEVSEMLNDFRAIVITEQEDEPYDPYGYFPCCDVEGCDQVSVSGGGCWRETGYWSVCSFHADQYRKGMPQPQMKQASIDKEKTRDPITGFLP